MGHARRVMLHIHQGCRVPMLVLAGVQGLSGPVNALVSLLHDAFPVMPP